MSEKFELARAADLQSDLSQPEGKNTKAKKAALRKVVSNMTVSNPEMLALFPEIVQCMKYGDLEMKRMCFLYLETYAKSRPQQATDALQQIRLEVTNRDASPVVRAIALRTMSSVPAKPYAKAALEVIPECLKSPDPYLRKTACFAVAKVWAISPEDMQETTVLQRVNQMLARESSPLVAAAAAQALLNITDSSNKMQFVIDFPTSLRLALMLADCPEFSQVSILTALSHFVPQTYDEAEKLADRVIPGLRHTNAAVAVGTARVLLMLSHYSPVLNSTVLDQIFAPLLSQLNRPPEIQYVVLRNILLILQLVDQSTLERLKIPPQAFFCRASDVAYIRSTKIDILAALCTSQNSETIIHELLEFTKVKDCDSTKKAISLLGSIAMRIEEVAPFCVRELERFSEKESQAVTSLVNIIRRYPNANFVKGAFESLWALEQIPTDEEARQSYVWLIGKYYKSGAHATKMLEEIIDNFASEPLGVQYSLIAACVRVFMRFPQDTQGKIVPRIFEIASETSANPDIREKALLYWRILSYSPVKMASIINDPLPPMVKQLRHDPNHLEDLELSLGNLSSIYLKPADQLFRVSRSHQLKSSKALLPRKLPDEDEADVSVHYDNASAAVTSPQAEVPFGRQGGQTGYFSSPPPTSPTSPTEPQNVQAQRAPAPPLPRSRTATQQSLQAQFSGMDLNSGMMSLNTALVEDHNERLIDI